MPPRDVPRMFDALGGDQLLRLLSGRAATERGPFDITFRLAAADSRSCSPAGIVCLRHGLDGSTGDGPLLRTRNVTAASILNETTLLVRATSTWGGLLVLLTLPYRFAQVWFVETLIVAGAGARQHGAVLSSVAGAVALALALNIVARLIFARACRLQQNALVDIRLSPIRLPLLNLAVALYTGAFFALLSVVVSFAVVPLALTAIFSALAIATAELNEKASLTEPFRVIAKHSRPAKALAGVFLTMTAALIMAWINIYVAFQTALWAAGGVLGLDVVRWTALLSPSTRLFTLLVLAGALAAIEPFWIAAHVIYVGRLRSHRSGEDLQQWLDEIVATDSRSKEMRA